MTDLYRGCTPITEVNPGDTVEFDPTDTICELVHEHTRNIPFAEIKDYEIAATGFLGRSAVEATEESRFRAVARALRDQDDTVFPLTTKEPTPMKLSTTFSHAMNREVTIGGLKMKREDAVPLVDMLNALTEGLRIRNDPTVSASDQAIDTYGNTMNKQEIANLRYQLLLAAHGGIILQVTNAYIERLKLLESPLEYINT